MFTLRNSLLRSFVPRVAAQQQRWLAVPQRRKPHGRGKPGKGGAVHDAGQLRNQDVLSGGFAQLRVVSPDGETAARPPSAEPC